ncbi:hypothetical protein GSH19_04145 [Lactobacillus sp. S2-2]|uniref:hypothetical protein n=1 Tax=Lactobacillus sp. S2-2 TaxID=2692917 RepID=UPI001F2CFEE9|nr:hypothetical protein [Lactobacillus sp. S2-2]MCF6515346.1 hypothetical protein [Lactobacillus sp. S2-2]
MKFIGILSGILAILDFIYIVYLLFEYQWETFDLGAFVLFFVLSVIFYFCYSGVYKK